MTISPQDVAALVERLRACTMGTLELIPIHREHVLGMADALEALMRECERLRETVPVVIDKVHVLETLSIVSGQLQKAEAERDALAAKLDQLQAEHMVQGAKMAGLERREKMLEAVVEAARSAFSDFELYATHGSYEMIELGKSLSTLDGDKQ